MHAFLKGHSTPITGLGPIADLEATYSAGNVELEGTAPANAVSQQAQFWIEGEADRGDIYPLPADVEFLEGNILNTRVQSLNAAGKLSPWSNIARFAVFNSAAVIKDVKFFTYMGAGTGIPSLNLDSMDGAAALSRASGDAIIVGCSVFGSSGNATQQTLPTGFEECRFVNLAGVNATRSAWKLSDGTETTVPLVITGSGTNTRVNFFAASFSIVGTPLLGETLATPEATTGNPAAQTISTSETGDTRIAVSWKSGSTGNPAWDFSGYLPLYDKIYSNTTTVRLDSRLQIAVLPPSAPLANITVDMADNGNNTLQTFYIVVRPT